MLETVGEILLAGTISGLLFFGLHRFPWRQLLNGKREMILDPPWSYVCGVLGLGLIYSGLVVNWWLSGKAITGWMVLGGFWSVVIGGGGVILGYYSLEARLETRAQAKDAAVRREIEERRNEQRKW